MKVLFVSSGNSDSGISPIIKNQGESIKGNEIYIDYFTIKGKGIKGYLNNIFSLKKHLKNNHYDIIHSHFFLSSIVASFATSNNLVVSLMGSDVYISKLWILLIKLFYKTRWNATIVKSKRMAELLTLKNLNVIPNGVNLDLYYPVEKINVKKKLGWDNRIYILFASNANRTEKNFMLAKEALELIKNSEFKLVTLQDIPSDSIINYLNAADVLLMTSKYEGSPNIIKEAMACNCPIVSTDVGDVREIIGKTEGCYISSFNPNDVADKIKRALEFGKRTNGRERIIELGLDSDTIAKRIIALYNSVVTNRKN